MNRKLLRWIVLLFASTIVNTGYSDTTFVLDETVPAFLDGLNDGDTISIDGIELTFTSVVTSNGSLFGDVESNGILISAATNPMYTDVVSFSVTFNQDVQILNYTIGAREDIPTNSTFSLVGSNGLSDPNVIPDGTSFDEITLGFLPGTIPVFEGGETYAFSHNLSSVEDSLFNLKGITVAVAVPEPGLGFTLFLMGFGSLIGSRRRCNK